ncbi:hypothetical protein C9928_05595 [Pseudidiomarina aestuarii]|uniref:Uncharacterized protein n=1 Tax=Pseudidiomarina aestuarii TaxID=624146 RepID=A0A6N4DGK0_9GAMM|nr:hypothetical protein C9928_05595 [Pseudidiomarina aestuarii]
MAAGIGFFMTMMIGAADKISERGVWNIFAIWVSATAGGASGVFINSFRKGMEMERRPLEHKE